MGSRQSFLLSIRCRLPTEYCLLEVLSDDKVELTGLVLGSSIKAVSPIQPEQAYHRQHDPYSSSGSTLELEWIVLTVRVESVSSFPGRPVPILAQTGSG